MVHGFMSVHRSWCLVFWISSFDATSPWSHLRPTSIISFHLTVPLLPLIFPILTVICDALFLIKWPKPIVCFLVEKNYPPQQKISYSSVVASMPACWPGGHGFIFTLGQNLRQSLPRIPGWSSLHWVPGKRALESEGGWLHAWSHYRLVISL